jgi:glutamine amidotransferase
VFNIEIIDLGINNISSVVRAFKETPNTEVSVIEHNKQSQNPDLLVLPGLGYFERGVESLDSRGFRALLEQASAERTPVAGICLGMQLLGNFSEESPRVRGLGLIDGQCIKFPHAIGERVPNTGWNSTALVKMESEFPSIANGSDFYFVHSYYFAPTCSNDILSVTQYGEMQYPSAILKEKTIGFQFHPEKSAKAGRQVISDLVKWASREV